MSTLNLVHQAQQMLANIDWQINECYIQGIDCSYLVAAKTALTYHITTLQQSIAYQLDAYSAYGVLPDSDELDSLLEEVGYDQAKELYGDELDELLAEVGRT